MNQRLAILASILLPACGMNLCAGTLSFTGECARARAVFEPGEAMEFHVRLLEDGRPADGWKLQWTRTGDDQKTETGTAVSSSNAPLTVTTSLGQPGFVHIQVRALGADGKPLRDARNQEVGFDGGAGVGLAQIGGQPEPADFEAFWARQKAKLAQVPLKADLKDVPARDPAYKVFDVKVDCAGGRPVSGYLARPAVAAPKSLQAQVGFMGYGVASASPDPQPGKLTFNINAHGIENGHDPAFYQALKDGELKGYAFDAGQNADPETAYFNGMMLRVMRALEFVKSLPEWNGKDLIVTGGSQGGLQALNAAALDSDVTQCSAYKPWCCDLAGVSSGRLRGWRPDYAGGLAYYDPVNQARHITCRVWLSAGLGDYVCPPSGITAVYNAFKTTHKKIEYIQGATHGNNPPGAQKFTLESK